MSSTSIQKGKNPMTEQKLKNLLSRTLTTKKKEILSSKPKDKQFLVYDDMEELCDVMEAIWIQHCDSVPKQIEVASNLAKAVLAPDYANKLNLITKALSLGTGIGGIALIIAAVGTALGWGAGIVATVTAVFMGTALFGPLALVSAGVLATIIAGYFMFANVTDEELSKRAFDTLKSSTLDALHDIWREYGKKWHDKENL